MRRKVGLFLVFGAVLPLAIASVAWACGVLATLKLDTRVASPGQTITATGKNYGTAAGQSAVSIRLKSRSGQVLAMVVPDGSGRISGTFALPAALDPGWYVVLATQTNANGTPKSGTPGRTSLRVQGGRRGQGSATAPAWAGAQPGGPSPPAAGDGGTSNLPLPSLLLAVALSLSMLGGGWVLLARKRTATGPRFGV